MPHLTFPIVDRCCPLIVFVGPSEQRIAALERANLPVPSAVPIRMIIDTGATGTAIEESILKSLGLTATGTSLIHTPATKGVPTVCPAYDVLLAIAHTSSPFIHSTVSVTGTTFAGQGIDGLIGMDVLKMCLLIVDGVAGHFTLAF